MRLSFTIFGWDFGLAVRNVRKFNVEGYTNRCSDGYYIVTLDYDNLEPSWIIPELKRLQEDWKLGDFLLMKSNKGYHAVCLDKVTLKEFTSIAMSSSMDQYHFSVPLLYGKRIWTLRYSEKGGKKPYLHTVVDNRSPRKKSKAHVELLNFLHGIEIFYNNMDDSKKEDLIIARYRI